MGHKSTAKRKEFVDALGSLFEEDGGKVTASAVIGEEGLSLTLKLPKGSEWENIDQLRASRLLEVLVEGNL